VDKKQSGPAKIAGNDNAAKPSLDEKLEEGLEGTFPASDRPPPPSRCITSRIRKSTEITLRRTLDSRPARAAV